MAASDQVRAVVVDNKNPAKLVIAPATIQPRGPNDVTVKLTKKPPSVRTMLADFVSVDDAARVTSSIIASGIVPAALEFMDNATIRVVEESIYAGSETRLLVRLASGTLMTVRRQAGLPPVAIGETVSIRWDREQARLLEGRRVSAVA